MLIDGGLFWAYFAYHRCLLCHVGPAIPTSACLHAATLGANWVYWPSGSDFGQAQRSPSQATQCFSLGWGLLLARSLRIDTRYKEPQFTVSFDGCKEARTIGLMWSGIKPGTCRLLGGRDNPLGHRGSLLGPHETMHFAHSSFGPNFKFQITADDLSFPGMFHVPVLSSANHALKYNC
jgi:hypothetical protein